MSSHVDEAVDEVLAYWEGVVRPELVATTQEGRRPAVEPETPEAALARLRAEGWGPIAITPDRLAMLMRSRLYR